VKNNIYNTRTIVDSFAGTEDTADSVHHARRGVNHGGVGRVDAVSGIHIPGHLELDRADDRRLCGQKRTIGSAYAGHGAIRVDGTQGS